MIEAVEQKEQTDSVEMPDEMETIENLADSTETSDTVLAGIMLAQKWKKGKTVSRQEFLSAKKEFFESRADGKRDSPEEQDPGKEGEACGQK